MIESTRLTKRLGGRLVVDEVSFLCEPGTVTGFLGPNGAGKTTTMRMLCGLSKPDGGSSAILGGPFRELPNPAHRVGILLDAAAQHDGRRGREALAVSAQTMGASTSGASKRCSRASASTGRPRASACASTRSACASAWGSRTRSSATRRS
jgi:ABC-2 type transport system ATP-binding protein